MARGSRQRSGNAGPQLTTRQSAVLAALEQRGDGLLLAEILAAAGLPADAGKTITALAKKGLVRVEKDAERRERLWSVSASGAQTWPAAPGVAPPPPGPREGFRMREAGGLRLVMPVPGKTQFSDTERRWRSVILDPDGRIVSAGFPKFHGWGEHSGDTSRLRQALGRGEDDVWFSEKRDGSLVIRSVIAGEVVLRTRGMLDAGETLSPLIDAHVRATMPQLLDPRLMPEASLLFEFTSPEHPIVVPYPTTELTLIGASDHAWPPRLAARPDLEALAAETGVPLVESHDLPRDPRELREAVRSLTGSEGVVVRCNGGQTLVKLKSAEYLAAHSTRFSFTPERVRSFAADYGVQSEDDFVRQLIDEGVPPHLAEAMRANWRSALRPTS